MVIASAESLTARILRWLSFVPLVLIVNSCGAATLGTQLNSYIHEVLAEHPELRSAEAEVAAAQARADGLSRPLYNPELTAEGEHAASDTFAVGLNQTLDFAGKRAARTTSGHRQLAAVQAARDARREDIATTVLAALADYQAKQALLALAGQRLELLKRFAEIAERQYRAGDTGVLDRDLGALAQAEAIATTGRAEFDLLQARQTLDEATRNPTLEPPALIAIPPAPVALSRDAESLALALPEVRSAMARSEAAEAEIAVAHSETKPDPTLSLRVGRESGEGANSTELVGLQLSIPLFVRNNYRSGIDVAAATATEEAIKAEAKYRQALQRLKSSAVQYQRSYDAWQRWETLYNAQIDISVELLDKVWRVREISTAHYLLQLKQLLDGRAAGVELRAQTWAAWARWLTASGQWQNWLDSLVSAAATPSGK